MIYFLSFLLSGLKDSTVVTFLSTRQESNQTCLPAGRETHQKPMRLPSRCGGTIPHPPWFLDASPEVKSM
jgi:hypothetical protein